MMRFFFVLVCLFAPTNLFAVGTYTAQQYGTYLMDRAGETRMLTQRLLRRACYVNVDADLALGEVISISADRERFMETISMIRDGEGGYEPVRSPRVVSSLSDVDQSWMVYGNFVQFAERGAMPDAYLRAMVSARPAMIAAQEKMVAAMARTYGHGRLDPYSANTISHLARLRMLSNLIAVEHCLLMSNISTGDAEPLQTAVERFAQSLDILQRGNDGQKILPPTPVMLEAYGCVRTAFEELSALVGGSAWEDATIHQMRPLTAGLEQASDAALKQLEAELVGIYTDAEPACAAVGS